MHYCKPLHLQIMVEQNRQIHIGTSGWSCDHWKGPFYPCDLPGTRMLEYYAQRFRSVEINSSFFCPPYWFMDV
jgi:uncharacterized protein YecE (DUF72 family)